MIPVLLASTILALLIVFIKEYWITLRSHCRRKAFPSLIPSQEWNGCYLRKKIVPEQRELLEDDVMTERFRVLELDPGVDKSPMLTQHLTKEYKTCCRGAKLAVSDLSFGVKKGECFGLLGVNGAGKTSTFQMLVRNHSITNGDAFVEGHNVTSDYGQVRHMVGYCPQFDALNLSLTGRELLIFYARVRGIPGDELESTVNWGLTGMQLTTFADVPCRKYSGGNKRKLSTAIALLGNPPIVLLDEPTAGMDPAARRFTWNRIAEVMADGRSVILTSHSMEECEALCSRIGIMVGGQLKCLGTVGHLKEKYGSGYTMTLKVSGQESVEVVSACVAKAYPAAMFRSAYGPLLTYQLLNAAVNLAKVFEIIAAEKAKLPIDDFSISQTSLDEVFIHFAQPHYDAIKDSAKTDATKKDETKKEA